MDDSYVPYQYTTFAPACAAFIDHLLATPTVAADFAGVIHVAWRDRPLVTRATGLAQRDFTVPHTPATKFNMGSLGKMFTAVAVARLVEQGALTFQDALVTYLPRAYAAVPAAITVHHALTHTAGFADVFTQAYFRRAKHLLRSDQALLRLLPRLAPSKPPGQRWRYSNAGYLLLGQVIETITGQSYHEVIHTLICDPAAMTDTHFMDVDVPLAKRAVGYTRRDDDGVLRAGAWRTNIYLAPATGGGAAGGGYTTAKDLSRFAAAVQDGTIVAPQLWAVLTQPQVEVTPGRWYGYGFDIDTRHGIRIVGHDGGIPGFDARLTIYGTTGISVAVLANADQPAAQAVADAIQAYLVDQVG